MTKLATYTVSAAGGDSSVTFSNIPQTYTDLIMRVSVQLYRSGGTDWYDARIEVNGETSGYEARNMYSVNTSQSWLTESSWQVRASALTAQANTYYSMEDHWFPDYTNTSNMRRWRCETIAPASANGGWIVFNNTGLKSNNNNAITSIKYLQAASPAQNVFANTRLTLYGMKKN